MTASFEKKLILAGFAGAFVVELLLYVAASSLMSFLYLICMLVAAAGFGLKWMKGREMLDLALAGAIGLVVVSSFARTLLLRSFGVEGYLSLTWIFIAIAVLYYLIWAFKFKDKNLMVTLLLLAAATGVFFGGSLINALGLPRFFSFALDMAVSAVPVIAAYFEED